MCLPRHRRLWDNLHLRTGDLLLEKPAAWGRPGVRPDGSPGLRVRSVLGGVTASHFCSLSCLYFSFLSSSYLLLVCLWCAWVSAGSCVPPHVWTSWGNSVELILSMNPGDVTQAVGLSGRAPSHVAIFLGLQLYYPNSHLAL